MLLEALADISLKSALKYNPQKTFRELLKLLRKKGMRPFDWRTVDVGRYELSALFKTDESQFKSYNLTVSLTGYGTIEVAFDGTYKVEKPIDNFSSIYELADFILKEMHKFKKSLKKRAGTYKLLLNIEKKYRAKNIEVSTLHDLIEFKKPKRDIYKLPFYRTFELLPAELKLKFVGIIQIDEARAICYINKKYIIEELKNIIGDLYEAGFVPNIDSSYDISVDMDNSSGAIFIRMPNLVELNRKYIPKNRAVRLVVETFLNDINKWYKSYMKHMKKLVENKKSIIKEMLMSERVA